MTQKEKQSYETTDALRAILMTLKGRKFRLDCGHHFSIGHNLGNDITLYNDNKKPKIVCSQCGY